MSLCLSLFYIAIGFSDNLVGKLVDFNYAEIDEKYKVLIKPSSLKTFGIQALACITVSSNLLIYLGMAYVFSKMSKGHVFSLPTVKSIRLLGFMILLYALISILSYPLMVGLWTYDNPKGERLLSVSLNSYQSMLILMGGLFLIIGHIYTEAVRLAEENRQYV